MKDFEKHEKPLNKAFSKIRRTGSWEIKTQMTFKDEVDYVQKMVKEEFGKVYLNTIF